MAFLIYVLWLISLLLVAGELDRMLREKVPDRLEWSWAHSLPWFVPAFTSLLLPGSGQFLNRQPIKAAMLLLWPILSGFGFFPRPWQTLQLRFFVMAAPWYLLALADALIVALVAYLIRLAAERRQAKAALAASAAQVQSMTDFLERRKRQQAR